MAKKKKGGRPTRGLRMENVSRVKSPLTSLIKRVKMYGKLLKEK